MVFGMISYSTEELFCRIVSTRVYVDTGKAGHEMPVVFYRNVELWWEWEGSGLCEHNRSYLLLANLSGKARPHLFPIRPHYFIGRLLRKLEGYLQKFFESEVSRFFLLQRYKIRVCLLPVLYHDYTAHI
jgi:hypothetical protein